MLPSYKIVFDVLISAASSSVPIAHPGVPDDILAAAYPEIYNTESRVDTPTVSSLDTPNVKSQIPFRSRLAVMASGGIASTAAMWKVLAEDRECKVFYGEHVYQKYPLDTIRRNYVKNMMLLSRAGNGYPLADAEENRCITWLETVPVPAGTMSLNRNARLILLALIAYEKLGEPVTLVWGSVFDSLPVFRALAPWNMQHVVLFHSHEEALLTLMHADYISKLQRQRFSIDADTITPGAYMGPDCMDACSCWDINSTKSDDSDVFPTMCKKCLGCKRYTDALYALTKDAPLVQLTRHGIEDSWQHVPSLIVEPNRTIRKSSIKNEIGSKKTKRQEKIPKKKTDSDVEEEEEINSESDEEYGELFEDEEDPVEDQDVEELPDDLLSDDDLDGYDSEPKRKRRKKY